MNYRHAYHAGNFADVLKHLVLVLCLEHLKKKSAPFRVIDTHAGSGRYALDAVEMAKTGEWRHGIAPVLDAVDRAPLAVREGLAPYLTLVRRERNAEGVLAAYPGSPAIAAGLMRPGDTLVANELHPEDAKQLSRLFARDKAVKVTTLDAWTALKSLLPPSERRGLILIDPPFEQPGELVRLTEGLDGALDRFKSGTYLLWYPIKDVKPVERFRRGMREVAARHRLETVLDVELLLRAPRHPEVLSGCGLIVANPPFTLAPTLETVLPWITETLAQTRDASGQVRRLT